MPDCYLCGAYIERGRGYRRHVEVDSSTRVYFGRRSGSSYGSRTALRTLCARCAEINDRVAAGAWARTSLYVAAYVLSAWIGWHLVLVDSTAGNWIGIVCLLGVPVILGGCVVEEWRETSISEDVRTSHQPEDFTWKLSPVEASKPALALTQRHEEPRKPDYDLETLPADKDDIWSYRADDNIFTWSDRVVAGLDVDQKQARVAHLALSALARAAYPAAGENIRAWAKRAKAKAWESD